MEGLRLRLGRCFRGVLAAKPCLHHEAVLGCLALLSSKWQLLLIGRSLVGLLQLFSGSFLLRTQEARIFDIFLLFESRSTTLRWHLSLVLALGRVSNGAWDAVAGEVRITDGSSWKPDFLLWVELSTDFAWSKLLIGLVAN